MSQLENHVRKLIKATCDDLTKGLAEIRTTLTRLDLNDAGVERTIGDHFSAGLHDRLDALVETTRGPGMSYKGHTSLVAALAYSHAKDDAEWAYALRDWAEDQTEFEPPAD